MYHINTLRYLNEKVKKVPTPRLVHHRVRSVECEGSYCYRKFARRKEMVRHVRNDDVHLESEDGTLLCMVTGCFKQWKTNGGQHAKCICHNQNESNSVQRNQSSDFQSIPASEVLDQTQTDHSHSQTSTDCSGMPHVVTTAESLNFQLICPEGAPWKCPLQYW
jgi:hypothetical protein